MSSISQTYSYKAQTVDGGEALTGTIDAGSADQARMRLETLRLRVIELGPAAATSPAVRPLRGEDFITFNQQLAHLTAAGLPLEHGLRLIAQDMRRGRVANTIRQIASELESGTPLGQAFEKHASSFPPAYGRLIDAGVRTNNLSGMLLNLGEHLRTLSRLRAALWRALAYPMMVFISLCLVVAFLGAYVLPQFEEIYRMWHTRLPWATEFLIQNSHAMGVVALLAAGVVIGLVILWQILRATGKQGGMRDLLVLRLPLVGPVVHRSLISRWCDAVRLGVIGGMDLPAAMRTAADAVASNRLRRDVEKLAATVESGRPLADHERLSLIPGTATAAIELSSDHGGLPQTLATLSNMYQQQAQARVGAIPAILTPLLLTLLTGVIGFIILAMFLPFTTFFGILTGK